MGVPEFQTVVASAPRESLHTKDLTDNAQVAAGADQFVDFYAPSGNIGVLQSIKLLTTAPPNATSGTHFMLVSSSATMGGYIKGISSYNQQIYWNRFEWINADNDKEPSDGSAAANAIKDVFFDDVTSLRIQYENDTDVVQTNIRDIEITYLFKEIG